MIISVQNHKGGVGKTATAVSLAALATATGHSNLLVDLDPQASATDYLNIVHETGIAEFLLGTAKFEDSICSAAILGQELQVLAADEGLGMVDASLYASPDPFLLKRKLARYVDHFDFIFIDSGPSVSNLSVNAFFAADIVICPLTTTSTSLPGVERLVKMMNRAAVQGHSPKLFILPLAGDKRLRERQEILDALESAFGTYPEGLLLPEIRYSSAMSRSYGERASIVDYFWEHRYKNGNHNEAAKRAFNDYTVVFEIILGISTDREEPIRV